MQLLDFFEWEWWEALLLYCLAPALLDLWQQLVLVLLLWNFMPGIKLPKAEVAAAAHLQSWYPKNCIFGPQAKWRSKSYFCNFMLSILHTCKYSEILLVYSLDKIMSARALHRHIKLLMWLRCRLPEIQYKCQVQLVLGAPLQASVPNFMSKAPLTLAMV